MRGDERDPPEQGDNEGWELSDSDELKRDGAEAEGQPSVIVRESLLMTAKELEAEKRAAQRAQERPLRAIEGGGGGGSGGKTALIAVSVVALLMVLAVGGWGYSVMGERDELAARKASLEGELETSEGALSQARGQVTTLTGQLESCVTERASKSDALDTCEDEYGESERKLTNLQEELEVCQKATRELEAQAAETTRRTEVLGALAGRFQEGVDAGTLSVEIRGEQMVVQLPADAMFASGSAVVLEDGAKTLKAVAKILKDVPRRKLTVAGHSDSRSTRKKKNEEGVVFSSNWELSAARAVKVTEQLIDHGVSRKRLVAAGYGQHAPIAKNKSKKGREKNRRIEIILEPDFEAQKKSKKKSKKKRSKKKKSK